MVSRCCSSREVLRRVVLLVACWCVVLTCFLPTLARATQMTAEEVLVMSEIVMCSMRKSNHMNSIQEKLKLLLPRPASIAKSKPSTGAPIQDPTLTFLSNSNGLAPIQDPTLTFLSNSNGLSVQTLYDPMNQLTGLSQPPLMSNDYLWTSMPPMKPLVPSTQSLMEDVMGKALPQKEALYGQVKPPIAKVMLPMVDVNPPSKLDLKL